MAATRPRSVTLACLYAGVGAAFGFVSLVSLLGSWGSVEMQDQVQRLLSEPPLKGSDLSVDRVLSALRWAAMAGVAVCVATMVFAVFTFRGDRGSRIGLTVLCGVAAVAFVTLGLYGVIPAMLAVTCIVLLWTRDARAYFSGEEPPVRLGAAPSVTARSEESSVPVPPSVDRRPTSVVTVLLIMLIGSTLAGGLGALSLLSVLLGRGELERSWERPGIARDLVEASGLSLDDMIRMITLFSAVWVVLSAIGVLVALWASLSRSPRARVGLFAMTIVSLAASLAFFPVGLPVSVAAIVVLVQLNKAETRVWYAGDPGHRQAVEDRSTSS